MAHMGDIFRPRALESTTKTPLRAATMMKSAMAASETNNFSPESFPFVALIWTSRGFQLALASRMATVARASPRQMGARYFFLFAGVLTASKTDSAVLLWKNDAGVTLVGELRPKCGVVCAIRIHKASHFGARTLAGEKLACAVFEKFLTFA